VTADLTTAEGRNARLDDLYTQGQSIADLPRDTDADLLAVFEARQRNELGYAELFRAETDATRGNRVAHWAFLDAIEHHTAAAQRWADRAEQMRTRIAAEAGPR
jgi:hypothetical protein